MPRVRTPSWRRVMREKPASAKVERRAGTTYFAANCSFRQGDFLGDTITQVIAASIIFDAERPKDVILSLYKNNLLNFLWDKFIIRSNATVLYDDGHEYEVGNKYLMLDERRERKEVQGKAFVNYKEVYRCMDMQFRVPALAGSPPDGRHNIIEKYYYGQEYSIPMPYWSCGGHHFQRYGTTKGDYVLVSPLEKCQNNRIFTFQFWKDVVSILIGKHIPVVVNERGDFEVQDPSGIMRKTFEPFYQLMGQVANARVVACGNTGPMWAAAACDTPSVICESTPMAMPEYSVHTCRLSAVRHVCNVPDPEYTAMRIMETYHGQ